MRGKPMRRMFSVPRFLVPLAILLWLLVSLPPWLLVPRAEAQDTDPACPSPSEDPLDGVHNPRRLRGINPCQSASGGAEMLWEATPADQGGLLEPSTGQHLEVLGAHVYDRTWGYTEIHPIYEQTYDDGSTYARSQASD